MNSNELLGAMAAAKDRVPRASGIRPATFWAMAAAFASFLILVRLNQGGSYEFIYFQF